MSSNTVSCPSRSAFELSRRAFVSLSSIGLAAVVLPDLAWAQGLSGLVEVRALSVGYVLGSEDLRNLKRPPRALRRPGLEADAETALQIVPATSLSTGDGELYGRALKIAIRGLYPPGAFEAKRREFLPLAADLEVIFPSFDPIDATPNRFQAWSFRRAGGWNPSPPIRFSFEHAAESPLELALRVRDASGAVSSFTTRFTIDWESGMPRLRRGLYLLGLSAGTWESDARLASLADPRSAIRYASILMAVELAPEEALAERKE